MASAVRRRRAEEKFEIHEDVPSTENTQVNDESMADEPDDYDEDDDHHGEDDQQSDVSGSSVEDVVDTNVQIDMEKLQDSFPGFKHKYRLIKRIGEGTDALPSLLDTFLAATSNKSGFHRYVLDRLQGRGPAV